MVIPRFQVELQIPESWIFTFHYPPLELASLPRKLTQPFLNPTLEFPHGEGQRPWNLGSWNLLQRTRRGAGSSGIWNLESWNLHGPGRLATPLWNLELGTLESAKRAGGAASALELGIWNLIGMFRRNLKTIRTNVLEDLLGQDRSWWTREDRRLEVGSLELGKLRAISARIAGRTRRICDVSAACVQCRSKRLGLLRRGSMELDTAPHLAWCSRAHLRSVA